MKFKIPFIILLSIFIYTSSVFAQTTTDIKVTIAVQSSEKEVKITVKNNTDDPLYKITTTLSNSIGVNIVKSGNFDIVGGEIVQSFADLTAKSDYYVTVRGERVSPTSKVGNITKSYTFITNKVKPAIIETSSTTTQPAPPDPIPGGNPANTSNQNTATNNTSGNNIAPSPQLEGLTQAQIDADKKGNGLIPCKDTCDLNDVLQLINNLIEFLITTIFVPIIILLFMYAGFKYITAEGNPSKVANLKKMVGHIVVGMLLVLCSWLIVKTVLSILTSDTAGALQFLK